jgi:hypothetical protein
VITSASTLELPTSAPERAPPLSEVELDVLLAPVVEKESETAPVAEAFGPVESAAQATRLAPSALTTARARSREVIGVLLEVLDVGLRCRH